MLESNKAEAQPTTIQPTIDIISPFFFIKQYLLNFLYVLSTEHITSTHLRLLEKTKSTPGQDLYLTIDNRLQEYSQSVLSGVAGSSVVMDVKTGEIIAMVSAPTFDPNLFLSPISVKNWNKLMNDKKKPLQNKALHGIYSPGSIFKLVVSLAGLESKTIKSSTTINCTGKTKLGNQLFHCWKKEPGHGYINLIEAIAASCDVYFYELLNPRRQLKNHRRKINRLNCKQQQQVASFLISCVQK